MTKENWITSVNVGEESAENLGSGLTFQNLNPHALPRRNLNLVGGASMPRVIAPHPAGYIMQMRLQKNKLDFDRSGIMMVEEITLP